MYIEYALNMFITQGNAFSECSQNLFLYKLVSTDNKLGAKHSLISPRDIVGGESPLRHLL